MNHPDFTQLRRLIDDAITFDDQELARKLADEGLRQAQQKELLAEVMYFRGQIAILEERFEDAIIDFDRAIIHNPHDGAAYNDRALCMIELGMIEFVMEYFDRGIEVESDYATIYHNKGWFLNKLGMHQEALNFFHQALKLEPHRVVTYENMGNVYELLGDIKSAVSAYKNALRFLKSKSPSIEDQIIDEIKRLEQIYEQKK